MDNKIRMNYEFIQQDLELSAIFPSTLQFPLWNNHSELIREDILIGASLMDANVCSNFPFYQDPFQEDLATLLDASNGFWTDMVIDANMPNEGDTRIFPHNINTKEESTIGNKRVREKRVLSYQEVSQYFYMPIVQAAKELNVGLTLLKKKCRELGIQRWPHRKMKSMQTLIQNVHELGFKEGFVGGIPVKIENLELEQLLMELRPSVKMQDETKKIRQACFKANYKKRKLMAGVQIESYQVLDIVL